MSELFPLLTQNRVYRSLFDFMTKSLITFQNKLGYQFKLPSILQEALTHKSYAHETLGPKQVFAHNERLEYLGDAVLDLSVSTLLMHHDFSAHEGELSKRRAALVNERTLAEVARNLGVQDHLMLGRGEAQSGGNTKDSILSSTFEAVVGAIYLDGGFDPAYNLIKSLFDKMIVNQSGQEVSFSNDFKSRLQELVQAKHKITPKYVIEGTKGPEHSKEFYVSVYLGDLKLGQGKGKSRKDAEQDAAKMVLESGKEI